MVLEVDREIGRPVSDRIAQVEGIAAVRFVRI
jgi:hypothetical protein